MKSLSSAVIAVCVMTMAGCIIDRHGDLHRDWWEEHHRGQSYQADRAEREHREYCGRSYDRSCEGWYRR